MKQLGNNESAKIMVSGSIAGIEIVLDCIHETNNEAIDGTDVDLSQIYLYIKDRSTNEQMNTGKVIQINGHTDRQIDRQMDRQTNRRSD